uniref:Uncharacterized protein n=1 Tax=Panagrolaimus sp. JU765 TaxID=591449 RepID=A0AC34QAP1_9BILA
MKEILVVLVLFCVTCYSSQRSTLNPVDMEMVLDLEEFKNETVRFFNNLETDLLADLGRFGKYDRKLVEGLVFIKLKEARRFFKGFEAMVATLKKMEKFDSKSLRRASGQFICSYEEEKDE